MDLLHTTARRWMKRRLLHVLAICGVVAGASTMNGIPTSANETVGLAGNAQVRTTLPGKYLSQPTKGDAYEIALGFIRSHKAAYRLTDHDLADLVVKDRYVDQFI